LLNRHVSRLALEPTELLASLANGWISGWVLLPLRAWVLRDLVRLVMRKPGMFGVEPARAAILPVLLGGSIFDGEGPIMKGASHIALSCLLDVSLGLAFWLAEYAIVRNVGVNVFAWGTF